MEMGTGMENVQIVKVDVAVVEECGYPEYDNRDDEGKTDGPKEIVNDSQESLEGRALDDMAEILEYNDYCLQYTKMYYGCNNIVIVYLGYCCLFIDPGLGFRCLKAVL
ncbi:hypothetical protein X943_001629 [Babesia divergens]|uniref:Uncharacterized protein n=1 Tax=Babesia divergens TaxID=32595 RepID=A0AAD9GBW9_BABDI|nr:hypothetical protein X943_001629 [Babesia divergens]